MVGTVEDVKRHLELPVEYEAKDVALELALEAASAFVLARLRYVEEDEADRVDTLRHVRAGESIYLSRRPVSDVTQVRVRAIGEDVGLADWTLSGYELVNGSTGELVITPAQASPIYRWRERVLEWVEVTYDVTGCGVGNDAPKDVRAAAVALAAYWHDLAAAAAGSELSLGQVRKKVAERAVPKWVDAALAERESGKPSAAAV